MKERQEYRAAFPAEYAGTVIGQLTKLGVEVKHVEAVNEDVCALTIDLDMALARRFYKWLQDTTYGKGTMSPEVWIRGVPS